MLHWYKPPSMALPRPVDGEHAELRHARYLHEGVGAEQFLLEIGDFGAVFVARGASDEVKPRDETFELEDSAHVHRGFGGGGARSIGGAAILPLALRDVSFDLTAKQTFVHLVRVVRAEIRSHEQKLCEARNLKVQTSPRATSAASRRTGHSPRPNASAAGLNGTVNPVCTFDL